MKDNTGILRFYHVPECALDPENFIISAKIVR